jgi:hypothetical protein
VHRPELRRWSAGDDPARYLLVMAPRTFALVEAIHAATERDAASMRELFARYDSELLR